MTYGEHMMDLSEICTQVWQQKDVEDKRNLLCRAVSTFKYKAKATELLERIKVADSDKCDFIASNLILNKTDKVVEMLKR